MTNVVEVHRLGKRLLVVGSSMGAGHMTAARALARDAERVGAHARVVDYLELPAGPQGKLTRGLYRTMVTKSPWLYDAIMRAWMRHPRMWDWFGSIGQSAYVRGLEREIACFDPDVVVSTYNLAGQMLGRLRRSGRLRVSAMAYVTDAGAHPYWVAPGVDLHLAPLQATASDLRAMGAQRVEVVAPLVEEPSSLTRAQARQLLGLSRATRVALVNGGSWGVGAVNDAARVVAATGTQVYVLCGRRSSLARRVSAMENCHAVGWTDQVSAWIKASDVVVDSAAGATGWEAIVAGRPLIVHKPLAGHGKLNATTLQSVGLATITRDDEQLTVASQRAELTDHHALILQGDAAQILLAAA